MQLAGRIELAVKRLSAVEAGARAGASSGSASNQHELNGTAALRALLGDFPYRGVSTTWVELVDELEPAPRVMKASWYDSRENQPGRSAEWRLYYSGSPVLAEGDLILVLRVKGHQAPAFISAAQGSTWAQQLEAVLGGAPPGPGDLRTLHLDNVEVEFLPALQTILAAAGVEVDVQEDRGRLTALLRERFPRGFPSTHELSEFARGLVNLDSVQADTLLLEWWSTEEALFRALEATEVEARLAEQPPFSGVDDFVGFSLGVLNRRKSRAGHALENHVEALLTRHGISYTRGGRTEGARKPDFILPGLTQYRDPAFPENRLLMLGAKTTCKDRWRQILNEAARVRSKHLLTLEPAISRQQLTEMRDEGVTLVVPSQLHSNYDVPTGMNVLTVQAFLEFASANVAPR